MSEDQMRKNNGSSQTQDYFQLMFDGADLFSSMWQPMLKSVGRWHLEVAGLGLKQGQAVLQLSRDLSRSITPGDIASANLRYWNAVTTQYAQSSQRLAATATRVVNAPIASEVVTLTTKSRGRDMIELPASETAIPADGERRVA